MVYKFALVRVVLVLFLFECVTTAQDHPQHSVNCRAIEPPVQSQLTSYLRERYGLPGSMNLAVEETGIRSGCYRELRISSLSINQPFELVGYLSPDHTLFAPQLFDLSKSYKLSAANEAAALQNSLIADPAPILGNNSAAVTVVVFSDFQCSFCKQAAEVLRAVVKENPKDLRVFFRHHPLESHKWAATAAKTAICVAEQSNDAFWDLHDIFFAEQSTLNAMTIGEIANNYLKNRPDVSVNTFNQCLNSSEPLQRLLRDENLGFSVNVVRTPTVFVNGSKQVGIADPEAFKILIHEFRQATTTTEVNAAPESLLGSHKK